jgi:hypothetical protein
MLPSPSGGDALPSAAGGVYDEVSDEDHEVGRGSDEAHHFD